jgi:hypothetical protein
MPTFIKTGFWEKAQKGYKEWLNLDNLIANSVGTGSSGQIAYFGTSGLSGSAGLTWDSTVGRFIVNNSGSTPSASHLGYNSAAIIFGYAQSPLRVLRSGGQPNIFIGTNSEVPSSTNFLCGIRTGAWFDTTTPTYSGDYAPWVVEKYLGGSGWGASVSASSLRMFMYFTCNGNTSRRALMIYPLPVETSTNTDVVYVNNLYIAAAGLFGSTVNARLHIRGDGSTASTNSIYIDNSSGTKLLSLSDDGQMLVGTGAYASFKFDVNGTARVQGSLIATGTSYISSISTIGTYNAFSTFNVVNDGPASIAVDRFSSNPTSPHFNLRKSRGTSAAPLIVSTNDELGYVGFWGHDGTAFQRNGIILVTAANVTGTTITPTMRFGVGTSAGSNQYYITIYNSGQVAFGNGAPEVASAAVSILSTTKGFLPPKMTTGQKTAIVTPVAGLVVYDTDLNKLCVYTGAAWQTISSA